MFLRALVAAGALWLVSGCTNFITPTSLPRRMTPAERNFEAVWRATRKVLRKYYFEFDNEDRRAGVIITEPLTGKYFGEFWRGDAVTARDLTEGSVQTVYRRAKVTIRATSPDRFEPVVEVRTYRSNRQEMQITSTSDAFDLFRMPGTENRRKKLLDYGRDWSGDAVSPLGRDENLERRLMADIKTATRRLRGKL